MNKVKVVLSWAGIVILAIATAVLEDIMYLGVIVNYMPPSVDLTGDLFWVFTVPLAQFMALAITGTAAWFLGLSQLPRLLTFWTCWSLARAVMLNTFNNPVQDIAIYLVWIIFWCVLIGLLAHLRKN